MTHIVMCRICKEKFDSLTNEYVMPSKNYYYHKKCWEDFGKKATNIEAEVDDQLWIDSAWRLLHKDLRLTLDFFKFKGQWDSFLKKKMTSKGIYFALRYFYNVKKGDGDRAEGGIGIVPYIYDESCKYWIERNKVETDLIKKIEDQVRQAENREHIIVFKKQREKKPTIDLSKIEGMEDE